MNAKEKTNNLGSRRLLLVWGYICVAVSLLVYVLVKYTHDARMSIFYALVPVLGACVQGFVMDRVKTKDENGIAAGIVNRIWGMVGVIFIIATIVCGYFFVVYHTTMWVALFILGLLAPGLASTMSGMLLKNKWMTFGGFVGIVLGVAMLCAQLSFSILQVEWCIAFAIGYVFMMIVPGHKSDFTQL